MTIAAVVIVTPLRGQCIDSTIRRDAFVTIGGIEEDLIRGAALQGCATHPSMIRTPMSQSRPLQRAGHPRLAIVLPSVESTWNSDIPFSMNDGARWAGRGFSTTTSAGVRVAWRFMSASVVPEILTTQNSQFPLIPGREPSLGPYANPWHVDGRTIDMPTRFGYRPSLVLAPGQSAVEVAHAGFAAGLSTENEWWGPGLRAALVMSNNAAGIPRAYARTTEPIHTPLGDVEARAMLGVLGESAFFDEDGRNDYRSISAMAATLRTGFDTGFTIGAARAAYATIRGLGGLPAHVFDFALGLPSARRDEIQSLFARWDMPASGLEVHAEWARLRIPSLRELLVAPQRTQAWVLGMQWLSDPLLSDRRLRFQAEASMLEQTLPSGGSSMLTYYVSGRVPQGYTQRGQVIGAATGPGSSSQWLAAQLVNPRTSFGVSLARIRWDDDAYYLQRTGRSFTSHDVSLIGGIDTRLELGRWGLRAEVLFAHRLNYLFQNPEPYTWTSAFDERNRTLNFGVYTRR